MAPSIRPLLHFLRSGDIVDIIAPSSAPESGKWRKGMKILQNWGLKPRLAKGALSPWLGHANTDSERLRFLKQAFLARDSQAVWMLRGGYGAQKLLPPLIKARPPLNKLFVGYSDGSALHLYLSRKTKASLHGPVISELSDMASAALKRLKDLLFGQTREIEFKGLRLLNQAAKARTSAGPVRGGNLSLLSASVGTGYMASFKSCFVFVEDVHEPERKIDRMLRHLSHAGLLKEAKGLLLGSFPATARGQRMLKHFAEGLSLPVVAGLPCGHLRQQQALPFNIPARLSFQGDRAALKIPLFSA